MAEILETKLVGSENIIV